MMNYKWSDVCQKKLVLSQYSMPFLLEIFHLFNQSIKKHQTTKIMEIEKPGRNKWGISTSFWYFHRPREKRMTEVIIFFWRQWEYPFFTQKDVEMPFPLEMRWLSPCNPLKTHWLLKTMEYENAHFTKNQQI